MTNTGSKGDEVLSLVEINQKIAQQREPRPYEMFENAMDKRQITGL